VLGLEEMRPFSEASPELEWPHMDETSAYAACYTTGTTGKPKGVFYSHRDVYLHSCAIGMSAEISIRDTYCQIVPMFHALGWGLCQAATMVGARLVFPGIYTLDSLKALNKLIVDQRVMFVDKIPKTSVGKMDKKVIRKQYSNLYTE